MFIQLPEKVEFIIDTFTKAGYDAYAVGGCVRDSILGRTPADWDITTSALPEQVKKLFKRTVDTGILHGTVTIILNKEQYEVTTYRIDGEYEDRRHPKAVVFTANLTEDLKRRDFTINAMAYNDKTGIVDEFGGMKDIERQTIRCVGKAEERFGEDALRIMRAIRFSAQLGYGIEERTRQAIDKLAPTLSSISAERIQTELIKLAVSDNPDYLKLAYDNGVTKIILPEFDKMMETMQNNPHHCYSVGEHSLQAMKKVDADRILRLSMLFHDIGKPAARTTDETGTDHFYGHASIGYEMTKSILKRLKFDNDTIYKVCSIVRYHDYKIELTPKHVRRAVAAIGEDIFPYLFPVKKADIYAKSLYLRAEKLDELNKLQTIYTQITIENNCVSLKTLAVSGKDLINAGMKPGRELGETLNFLLEIVMDNPMHNTKEFLMKQIK